MVRRTGPTPRPGVTLVEILGVLLIIVILAALTTAAVMKALGTGKRAATVSEINNLGIALTSFNQKYGFHPPSYITEQATDGNQYVRRFQFPTNVNQPEYAVLKRMFPRWTPPLAPDP